MWRRMIFLSCVLFAVYAGAQQSGPILISNTDSTRAIAFDSVTRQREPFFTTAQINALIAPRPHLATAGNRDDLTPAAGLDRIERELRGVYQSLGQPAHWKLLRYDVGHAEPLEMRRDILAFLHEHL